MFEYQVLADKSSGKLETVSEPLFNILKRRELSHDEWKKVKAYADKLNISFFATIGFEEEVELIRELNCSSVKIASADINHYQLLRKVSELGINVQLDTGSSEIEEVKNAVQVLERSGCNSIIIHQCPSGYPARLESICLNMISTLREVFPKYPIAFSDHTPDADMDIAALAIGVNLIEKTITKDRETKSVEHVFSLEPHEMKSFINRVKDVEIAMGDFERSLTYEQLDKRKKIRRGAYLKKDIQRGDLITHEIIDYRRPCSGIEIDILDQLISEGIQAHRNMKAGEVINQIDLKPQR